jgi:hypothetical protein
LLTVLSPDDFQQIWSSIFAGNSGVFMVGQTIAERLCQMKTLTARHILQDEAAIFGAQGMVSEELESS